MSTQDAVTDSDLKNQAGYIKHRIFEPSGSRIVVYLAGEQGFEIGERYAVVCELHGAIVGVSSKRQALADMRHPIDFCQDCFEAVADQLVKEGLLEVVTDDHEQHCEVCGEPIEPGSDATHKLTPENWASAIEPFLSKDDMLLVATVAMEQTEKFAARVSALAGGRIAGTYLAALMLRVAKDIRKEGAPS